MNKPQNVYFNLCINNTKSTSEPAAYVENTQVPIVDRGCDYTLSIVRFFIPGQAIPIFVWDFDQPDKQLFVGLYNLGNNTNFSRRVLLDPSYSPLQPDYIWTYQSFLTMVNTAFSLAALDAGVNPAPVLWFDPSTKEFKLRWSLAQVNSGIWFVTFNSNMFGFVNTLPAIKLGENLPNRRDYQAIFDLSYPATSQTIPGTVEIRTEVNCQYAWNALVRIFIVSDTIGTLPERQYSVAGNGNGYNIITDFEPLVTNDFRVDDVFQYYPQGELRRIDIIDTKPLSKVDFRLYWEDRFGVIRPVLIPPNKFISLKILFQLKK